VRLGRARTARRPSRSRGDALRDDVEGEVEAGGHEMQRALREGQVFAEDVLALALALARLVGHLDDRSDTLKAPWATTMLLTMWRSPPAASVMIVPVKLCLVTLRSVRRSRPPINSTTSPPNRRSSPSPRNGGPTGQPRRSGRGAWRRVSLFKIAPTDTG
jgi:hypothetical protein